MNKMKITNLDIGTAYNNQMCPSRDFIFKDKQTEISLLCDYDDEGCEEHTIFVSHGTAVSKKIWKKETNFSVTIRPNEYDREWVFLYPKVMGKDREIISFDKPGYDYEDGCHMTTIYEPILKDIAKCIKRELVLETVEEPK